MAQLHPADRVRCWLHLGLDRRELDIHTLELPRMTPRITSDTARDGRRKVEAVFAFTPTRTYRVELETWECRGDEPRSECHVTFLKSKPHKHASLACLQDTGVLTDTFEREHVVEADHIAQITEWAEKEGY
jgi:hypothetical protein